jgi:4-hydroxy-tetrahydrodipicolinate reductase
LIFQASVGEPDSYDEIEIFGTPHIRSRIMGGVNGDVATCSIILNACHSIRKAMPGLRTMADITDDQQQRSLAELQYPTLKGGES